MKLYGLLVWTNLATLILCDKKPFVLDFTAEKNIRSSSTSKISRRSEPFPLVINDLGGYTFLANASLGTPPQPFQLEISTNDGDVVVFSPSAIGSTLDANASYGVYNANASSTYTYLSSNYNVTYAGQTGYTIGDVVNDTLTIGDLQFPNFTFASASAASGSRTGLLGIAYLAGERIGNGTKPYANLLTRLYTEGHIDVAAFSLFYNQSGTATGRLVFGGVDTGKFYGTMETLPFSLAKNLEYTYTTIPMDGITIISPDNTSHAIANTTVPVIADAGNAVFALPAPAVQQIAQIIMTTNNTSHGLYQADNGLIVGPCNQIDDNFVIEAIFGSTTISIPMRDFVLSINSTYCAITFQNAPAPNFNFIGVPFFRNAYSVFDYSHNQLSFAPVNDNASIENITAINPNGVAGLTGLATNSGSKNGEGSGSGLSSGAKAGIGVGVGVGVPILLAIILIPLIVRRRRRSKQLDGSGVKTNGTLFGKKAELAGAPNEKKIAEAEGDITRVETEGDTTRAEAEGDTVRAEAEGDATRAEVEGSTKPRLPELPQDVVNGKPLEVQEMMGSTPERIELPTEANEPVSATSGSATIVPSSTSTSEKVKSTTKD